MIINISSIRTVRVIKIRFNPFCQHNISIKCTNITISNIFRV